MRNKPLLLTHAGACGGGRCAEHQPERTTNDPFQVRVLAAATAAWWTVVIAAAFLTLQRIVYRGVMAAQPDWVVSFWGPGATWESIRTVWLQALVILKLSLWPFVLTATFLTLWARQLPARARSA